MTASDPPRARSRPAYPCIQVPDDRPDHQQHNRYGRGSHQHRRVEAEIGQHKAESHHRVQIQSQRGLLMLFVVVRPFGRWGIKSARERKEGRGKLDISLMHASIRGLGGTPESVYCISRVRHAPLQRHARVPQDRLLKMVIAGDPN